MFCKIVFKLQMLEYDLAFDKHMNGLYGLDKLINIVHSSHNQQYIRELDDSLIFNNIVSKQFFFNHINKYSYKMLNYIKNSKHKYFYSKNPLCTITDSTVMKIISNIKSDIIAW